LLVQDELEPMFSLFHLIDEKLKSPPIRRPENFLFSTNFLAVLIDVIISLE
jgi:hypothetical protein